MKFKLHVVIQNSKDNNLKNLRIKSIIVFNYFLKMLLFIVFFKNFYIFCNNGCLMKEESPSIYNIMYSILKKINRV